MTGAVTTGAAAGLLLGRFALLARRRTKGLPKTVHVAFSIVVGPDVYSVGRTNQERHGMALISRAQLDHVVPHGQGGVTGEENLVTACWACNYGKARFTLSQIALQDPRQRTSGTA